jgi:hypothetical protein
MKVGNSKGIKLSISGDKVEGSNGKQVEINVSICSEFKKF